MLGDRARLDGAFHADEAPAHEVGRLDPHDQALVTHRHLGGGRGLHVGDVLLVARPPHAVAHDVEEREDAGPRTVDDQPLEVVEVAPAGAAGVGDGRHARPQGEAVGIDAVVARVRPPLAGPREDVDVDVNQSGSDVQPVQFHGLERQGGVDLRAHGGDLAGADGHVAVAVDLVAGIDDVSAAEQEIILRRRTRRLSPCAASQQQREERWEPSHGRPRGSLFGRKAPPARERQVGRGARNHGIPTS